MLWETQPDNKLKNNVMMKIIASAYIVINESETTIDIGKAIMMVKLIL